MEERPFKRARPESSTTSPLKPLVAATKAQAAWRGFTVRQEGLAVRRKAAANSLLVARREHESTVIATRLRTPEYRQIARLCKAADPAKLARVDMALERLIGLVPIKEYCASQRRDCLARTALGEPPCVRNVLISGNLGVGKKLAAETLTELLRALGVARGMVSTRTTLEGLVLDVRRDVSCVIIDGLDKIESVRGKVDAVLANYPDHCFIFLGPTDRIEALHGAVSHFRKVEPAWLQLPNYAPAELAEIAQRRLVERGYALADGLGPCELQIALSATWSRDVLAMRNAHLASELVQRAVTHRNGRLALPRLLSAPLILSAADLGLQAHGLQSLLAERAAVDAEVAGLIGMAPLKRYLAELRAKVTS